MRWLGAIAAALILLGLSPASADVLIVIDKSSQSVSVLINGAPTYNWTVSTGSPGLDTPNGRFTAQRLARVYYSKKYDDAPMPNSVFFHGGYAIHGTYQENRLGSPVSHGCVRLSRANAVTLYNLVSGQGLHNTRFAVVGQTPQRDVPMARSHDRYEDRYSRYSGPVEQTFAARGRSDDYYGRPRNYGQFGVYDSPRDVELRRNVYWDDGRSLRGRERRVIQVEEPKRFFTRGGRLYLDNGRGY
jgi:L,D-transpeptidase catalytic domain